MVFPAIAQMPVGQPIYGTDAYGNPVDANGNPVQLDANGNPVVDGYGNDAYTWGRDTTQAEEKIILLAHTPGISTNASATSLP